MNAGGLPEKPAGIYRQGTRGSDHTAAVNRYFFSDDLLHLPPMSLN